MLRYRQLKNYILELASGMEPDALLPSFRALGSQFGSSQVTIKRALDELEAEGCIYRRQGSGVYVAPRYHAGNSVIAVLMLHLDGLQSGQILGGIQEAAAEYSANILLPKPLTDTDRLVQSLQAAKVFGCIINPATADLSNPEFIEMLDRLNRLGMRLVALDLPLPGNSCGFAGLDNITAFGELGAILLRRRRRNIALVGNFASKVYAAREKGFRQSVAGSAVRIAQLSSRSAAVSELACQIRDGGFDAVVIADAAVSIPLSYQLWCRIPDIAERMTVGGIVEEGQEIPCPGGVTLVKPNSALGKNATTLLFHPIQSYDVKLLKIPVCENQP